jgi:hypothetical protein
MAFFDRNIPSPQIGLLSLFLMERPAAFSHCLPMFLHDPSHRGPVVHQSSIVVIVTGIVNIHVGTELPLSKTKTPQEQSRASKEHDCLLSQLFHFRSACLSLMTSASQQRALCNS